MLIWADIRSRNENEASRNISLIKCLAKRSFASSFIGRYDRSPTSFLDLKMARGIIIGENEIAGVDRNPYKSPIKCLAKRSFASSFIRDYRHLYRHLLIRSPFLPGTKNEQESPFPLGFACKSKGNRHIPANEGNSKPGTKMRPNSHFA